MSEELSHIDTPTIAAEARDEWVEFVHFALGEDHYELELGRIQQIVRNPTVTPVPKTGPAIMGVTNLGDEIPVVIDLRELFGLPNRTPETDAVLLQLDRDSAQPAGLLVDDVPGIDAYHIDHISEPEADEQWDPPIERHWFMAIINDPEDAGHPTGVLDPTAIITEVREHA